MPNVRWRGVSLEAVLALAVPGSEARWVQASAGDFSVSISLQDARKSLLATHLEKEPLPAGCEQGKRILIFPGQRLLC